MPSLIGVCGPAETDADSDAVAVVAAAADSDAAAAAVAAVADAAAADAVAADAVAADALVAVVAVAVVAVALAVVVTAGVSEVFAVPADKNREVRAVIPPGDTAPLPPRVTGAAGVAAPAPASTMPAVNAADPAKSDRIRFATFTPFRICHMALAEESQSYRGQLYQRAQLSCATMTTRASVSDVNLLIRGGYVLTMNSAGDIPGGNVHTKDGEIYAIGVNLDASGAEVVVAGGKIVAPGLIDIHWHMWKTLLRGCRTVGQGQSARPVLDNS